MPSLRSSSSTPPPDRPAHVAIDNEESSSPGPAHRQTAGTTSDDITTMAPISRTLSRGNNRRTLSGSGPRSSRFIETPMEEYMPSNSVFELDLTTTAGTAGPPTSTGSAGGETGRAAVSRGETALRAFNLASHLAICTVLLAIMCTFLAEARRWYRLATREAIALMTVVGLDVILDFRSLVQIRRPWPFWALLCRLLLGLSYVVMFMIYIGVDGGRVFPSRTMVWGLRPENAGPIVYLLMWIIGVWNLVHVAVHRYWFGFALAKLWRRRGAGDGGGVGAGGGGRGASATASSARRFGPDGRGGGTRGWFRWWGGGREVSGDLEGGRSSHRGNGVRGGGDTVHGAVPGQQDPSRRRTDADATVTTTAAVGNATMASLHGRRAEHKTTESVSTFNSFQSEGLPSPLRPGEVG